MSDSIITIPILDWQPPTPLDAAACVDIPFPLHALPNTLRAAVEEVVDFVQCPVSMAVGSALGALSLAISPHVHIERGSGLKGPTNLYILTLGESGERKTSVDGYFLQPVQHIQASFNLSQEPARKRYKADMKIFNARAKGLERAIVNAEAKGQADKVADLCQQLQSLETQRPAEPDYMQLIYQDFTIEGLLKSLTRWPYGIINSAEAGGVLGGYGLQKERQLRFFASLNQLWDNAFIPVNRATEDAYEIKGVCVTLCLMTQPSSMAAFREATGELSRGTGFLARCLLSEPESTIGKRPYREAPSEWPALSRYHETVHPYLNKIPAMTDSRVLQPALMQFTPDAKACWVDHYNHVETSMAFGSVNDQIRDLASKVSENTARVACLFHCLEHGLYESVGLQAMQQAVTMMNWYLVQGKRFLIGMEPHHEALHADKVLKIMVQWCQTKHLQHIGWRDLLSRVPRHLRKKAQLEPTIALLEEHHHVQVCGPMIFVNPYLLT